MEGKGTPDTDFVVAWSPIEAAVLLTGHYLSSTCAAKKGTLGSAYDVKFLV